MNRLLSQVWLGIFLLFSITMIGCGTLNRNIEQSHLSRGDMAYAKSLDRGKTNLNINIGSRTFSTNHTASKYFVVPPFYSFETLGKSLRNYGYMKMSGVLPFFMTAKAAIYNQSGTSTGRLNSTAIPLIYSQWVAKNGMIEASRYEFLKIPLLGPCFAIRKGPNSGRPRFLWIPGSKK